MKIVLKLAWRSFRRHKRRAIITGSAIALGLAMMLVFVGLADDGHRRMAEMGIHLGSGNVVVQGNGYQEAQTLDYLVEDPEQVAEIARGIPGVSQAAVRLNASGLLSTGESSAAIAVMGVDPRIEPKISTIASPRKRLRGHYLRPRDTLDFENQPGDIYLGDELAKTLDLEIDDRVVLMVSPRGGGRPASAAFIVRGTFRTGLIELDSFSAQIDLGDARKLLGTGDAATQVAVMAKDIDDTDAIAAHLRRALSGHDRLEILTWKEALRDLYEGIVLDNVSMYLMMAIIFVIVALGIFNTVLMSVVERTRELGVMMALGTSKGKLFAAVLLESFILALVAAAVGLAIGLSLHAWLHSTGIDIASLYGENFEFAGIALEGRIYSYLTAGVVIQWTAVVIGIVLLSSVYPAYRASRLEPVEAMRHV